ncbi:MAG: PrsW family intramembrane metalloprotease [bacterium]|nr:PrsW family intramembrane metalloprotease [bacterium]
MSAFIGIGLGLLPGLIWLAFYLQEDPYRESRRLIFYIALWGAISALLAYFAEIQVNPLLAQVGIPPFDPPNSIPSMPLLIAPLIILAYIEELFKFGAAYFAVHKNPEFRQPIEAMVYTIVAALGFATVENIGAISGAFQAAPSTLAALSDVFQITSFRFIGATLLHTLTSGIVGYYWGLTIYSRGKQRFVVGGLIIATFIHAIFNYLIITFGNVIQPILFLLVIGFFVLGDFEKLKEDIMPEGASSAENESLI